MPSKYDIYKGIRILKCDSDNYANWQSKVESRLKREGGWGAVIHEVQPDEVEEGRWLEAQYIAMDVIKTYIGGSVEMGTIGIEDPHTLWKAIEARFASKSGNRRMFALDHLMAVKQGGDEDIMDYIDRFEDGRARAEQCGWNMDDMMNALLLLRSTNEEYNVTVQTLMNSGTVTYADTKERLRTAGMDRKRREMSTASTALFHEDKKRFFKKGMKCHYCGKEGHFERNCRKQKYDFRKWSQKEKTRKNSDSNIDSSNDNSSSEDEYSRVTFNIALNSTLSIENHDKNTFIADSGASTHMSHLKRFFRNMRPVTQHSIIVGNGSTIPVLGIGDISTRNSEGKLVILRNVLYAPELSCNLISIRKLQEAGHSINFPGDKSGRMEVREKNDEIVCLGQLQEQLYIMDLIPIKSILHDKALMTAEIWHQRLGHISLTKIQQICKNGGLKIKKMEKWKHQCSGCAKGKIKKKARGKQRTEYTQHRLEATHSDVMGPYTRSKRGFRYCIAFLDEATRRALIYFMREKREALEHLKTYQAKVENEAQTIQGETRKTMFQFQSDGGGEYTSEAFDKYLKDKGMHRQITNADTPSQNGLVERFNGTLQSMAFTMLKHAKLPNSYWPYAFRTACYIYNRIPTKGTNGKSPLECWNGKTPDLSNLRTFGCDAWVKKTTQEMRKGEDKAKLCTFLGYDEGLKGYILENKATKKVIRSQDVIFHEGDWLVEGIHRINMENKDTNKRNNGEKGYENEQDGNDHEEIIFNRTSGASYSELDTPGNRGLPDACEDTETSMDQNTNSEDITSLNDEEDPSPMEVEEATSDCNMEIESEDEDEMDIDDRPIAERKEQRSGVDYNIDYGYIVELLIKNEQQELENYLLLSVADEVCEKETPKTYEEAINGPQSKEWKKAIDDELNSLIKNNTWHEKPVALPRGRKCVGTKWIFKIKRDEKGNIARYKARLVAKGFTQVKGEDFNKTFAPVLQTALLRLLLAMAAREDWEIHQIDIKTAFLHGLLNEDIYIELPEGLKKADNNVRKLNKSIYGLKQSSRAWYGAFHDTLEGHGLTRTTSDPCCYLKVTQDGILIVLIHVDDAIIFSSDLSLVERFKKHVKKEYDIADMGELKYCLGWEVSRDRKKRQITVNQQQYTLDVLKHHKMMECNTVSTPAEANVNFSKAMAPQNMDERKAMQHIPYLKALGSLLYLSVSTRPDIAYAVSELSRHACDPGEEHWKGIKRIFRYLRGTSNYGLVYGNKKDDLHGFVDANYARCVDTRKSRYGGIFIMYGGPVDCRSKMEEIVALSSMEAEYIGACEIAKLGIWLARCIAELYNIKQPPVKIGIDNQSAKMFAEEHMTQNRSKHIDTRFHYVREKITDGEIELFYRKTSKMPADALTKPLGPKDFEKFRRMMGVIAVVEYRN